MSDVTKLGELLDASAQRDAVHIAVAPVIASEELAPGEHIGFVGVDQQTVGPASGNLIGIVDPFLKASVATGERFWMFLYPQTITSLRHQWTHPAFGAEDAPNTPEAESRKWIEAFAAELDHTYNRLMGAAEYWLEGQTYTAAGGWNDNYTYDNTEAYKRVDHAKWPIFWRHYEIVTGQKVKDHTETFFTCSC